MKLSPISDEQAWQLFELLEGNLTEPAAKELFKAMQGDANLKAHYEALAQTYLQPTTTIYPDAPSLKKKTSNRTVLFYASMSVAASPRHPVVLQSHYHHAEHRPDTITSSKNKSFGRHNNAFNH